MDIFVGNRTFTTTEEELRAALSPLWGDRERSHYDRSRDGPLARLWLCRDAERHRGQRGDCWA